MQTHCENCGNKLTPQQQKNTIQPILREFWNESVKETAYMIPYNDAFFEIVKGKYKGNLVHTFNVIK